MQAPIIKTPNNKKKQKFLFMNGIPETENDIFVKTNIDTTLDKLALQYYRDETKWKIIALANNLKGIHPPNGMTVRIPINPVIKFEID